MEQSEVPWTTTRKVFSSDPLFSCIFTLYILILLYFPHLFLRILLSPVLLITGTLLISLLRLGSTREPDIRPGKNSGDHDNSENPGLSEAEESGSSVPEEPARSKSEMGGFNPNPSFVDNFVEWNVKAPLEVIHEAYDEEIEGEEEKDQSRLMGIKRLPSLSLCYPESESESEPESDSESDSWSDSDFLVTGYWVSPENIYHRWEEEDREGLIEIRLDNVYHHHSHNNNNNKSKKMESDFHAEEENLIEIDISP